jgi:hypothetical protein
MSCTVGKIAVVVLAICLCSGLLARGLFGQETERSAHYLKNLAHVGQHCRRNCRDCDRLGF